MYLAATHGQILLKIRLILKDKGRQGVEKTYLFLEFSFIFRKFVKSLDTHIHS